MHIRKQMRHAQWHIRAVRWRSRWFKIYICVHIFVRLACSLMTFFAVIKKDYHSSGVHVTSRVSMATTNLQLRGSGVDRATQIGMPPDFCMKRCLLILPNT